VSIQYFAKAIVAGGIAFLGPIAGALALPEIVGFGDLTAGVWVAAVIALLLALGAILGLQEAPAKVSTSIRS
jgi:hypothetical protein